MSTDQERALKVNFYASLRPLVGEKTIYLELPAGCTVEQLLETLVLRYPALRPTLLHEDGSLQTAAHVFVNGHDAHLLPGGLLTGLEPGDSLDIFPPVGGGQAQIGMETRVLDLRGIPLWLLLEYLEKLGGQPGEDGWTRGPGWQARLTPIEDAYIGSLPVKQIRLAWQAEPQAHAIYWPKLEMKIMRGGG